MTDRSLELVRVALALHLDVDVGRISSETHLERDLGMDPLDLVLVVLRLEEVEEMEFPIAELEGVETVGGLASMVRAWLPLAIPDGGARPAPRVSGVRLLMSEESQEAVATYR